jgi:hypothetical protein
MSSIGLPELLIVFLIMGVGLLIVWPAARICRRIGFSPWLGVLAAFPVANVILLWVVAFAPWPGPPLNQRTA